MNIIICSDDVRFREGGDRRKKLFVRSKIPCRPYFQAARREIAYSLRQGCKVIFRHPKNGSVRKHTLAQQILECAVECVETWGIGR
jgi:hypothetical protein